MSAPKLTASLASVLHDLKRHGTGIRVPHSTSWRIGVFTRKGTTIERLRHLELVAVEGDDHKSQRLVLTAAGQSELRA